METHPPIVASPPPKYQGSTLGRIVGESVFSQILYWVVFCRVNGRLLASVQAELATLRKENTTNQPSITLVSKNGIIWGTVDETLCKANLKYGRAFLPFGGNEPYTEISQIPELQSLKRKKDSPSNRFSRCLQCGTTFTNQEDEPTFREFEFCGETEHIKGDCKREWLAKHPSACDLPKPEPKWVDGLAVHREGERQAASHPLTHSRRSTCERALHERKLFANVAAYQQRDKQLLEEARQLKKAADLYWQFCVAFEFPKSFDQEAMEKAAEHLIRVVPREHLELLFNQRKGKRHYVRHGAADLSFVRKQDLELATEF